MTTADEDAALHCPLCNYSLRGLVDPRCPECGFAFEWAELRETARNKHPYLFEHGAGHNLRTFWLTFWRDCRPRRFWRELSPVHPIRLRRLLIYWIINGLDLFILFCASLISDAVALAKNNSTARQTIARLLVQLQAHSGQSSKANISFILAWQKRFPPMTSIAFWHNLLEQYHFDSPQSVTVLVATSWTACTLVALLIFQQSMRRKKVGNTHIVRVAIYCCDFPVLMTATVGLALFSRTYGVLIVILTLAIVTTYRLYYAYSRYLRLGFALPTVLAAQLIVTLTMIIVVLQFTRLGYGWLPLK